jgi:uncharacterized protein YecE (DUF72 family)
MRVGTAGWSIPTATRSQFPAEGSHLQRYAQMFGCAEINSSFYKSHRPSTYAAWAAQTPPAFRFAVKLPQAITHAGRLRRAHEPLVRFLGEVEGLGDRLGALLVQLPPSLAFEARPVGNFFELLRALHAGSIVCEPRHVSWFVPAADRVMRDWHIGRVAADPSRFTNADICGGWCDLDASDMVLYHRWHGSPRMYWSRYSGAWVQARAQQAKALPDTVEHWFIFDNTAGGGAAENALEFQALCISR